MFVPVVAYRAPLALRLLAGTAFLSIAMTFAGPAVADGGAGGNRSSFGSGGGAGGINVPTAAGGAGGNGSNDYGGGGGGGAGAGTGGAGGVGAAFGGGNGGTGGVHGIVQATIPLSATPGSAGDPGAGSGSGAGGGGGAGGYGAVVTGGGSGTVSGAITGGAGGAGGASTGNFDQGGSGGSGGVGLLFTSGGATLMVTGAIQGGNGGVRGSSNGIGGPGAHGPGGQGIVGSNLTIINSGTIEGGLSGDGTTRAAALHFTGGGNTLTFLNATTGVSGGIVIDSGALAFNQSTAITVGNVISGGGGVNKQGNGTLTLSGSNTYTGGTTLTAGKLVVSQNANLGAPSGNLNFNGGTLQVTSGFTTARTATLVFSSTIEVDAGQSFTMSGAIGGAGTLTKTGGGTLTLSGSNTYFGGTTISDGTVSVSSDANLGAASGGLTFNGASTLQVTGSFTTARATVLNANGAVEVTAGQNFTMGGAISGTGGVIKTGTGTLTLTGTNTYTGGTTISDGTVSISSDANLGNANTPITLNNATNVGGAGTGADAVLRTTATFSSSRNIAFTSSGGGRIETDAGTTLTLSGAITTGGSASFIKQGAGTLVLTGDSSANYAGRTWVNDGTLRIEGGGKLGSTTTGGQAYISNGATAIVTGLGSSWETFGAMRVGEHGSGTLRIENGGSVKTGGGSGTVGIVGGGGDSSVTITGAGSQWVGNGTQVYIGHSNAGTLTLSDGGKFELTGANSTLQAGLVGGTAGGTINIGAAEGSAAAAAGVLLVGTVALNTSASKIVFNHTSSSYSFAPTISGAGSVRQVAGTTILTGITTYSGATAVTGGTLRAGQAGSFSANSAFTLSSGTTLDLAGFNQTIGSLAGAGAVTLGAGTLTAGGNNTSTTFSGSITGAGGFTKAGSGTLMLSGTSTYSGATAVTGGTLRAGQADSFSASSAFTLSSGTTLDLDGFNQTIGSLGGAGAVTLGAGSLTAGGNNTSTIFSGSVTGTGGFTKTGSGTLMLSGTSTYSGATTIQQGRLYAANAGALSAASDYTIAGGAALEIVDAPGLIGVVGSIAGAGSIQIGTGATLKAGSSNASTSFSGKIEGNGGLTKAGTGTLRLSGTSTYTGATRVEAGKLVVNGSLASNVTLDGGTLGGSGTIGALAVASGGTVAPGNSIGTLNVSGNVAFAAGSTYQVEINAAGQSDRIVATGLATISGGTVAVLAETGNYAASTTYTILTATGGVTGRFTTATSNLVFLAPSLAYDSNNVILTMTRNATGFGPGAGTTFVASTRNQGFIANAAEALGAGNAVYDALLSGTAAEARAGFDMLSGEAHAQAVSVLIDESRLVRETILSHLRGPLLTAPGGQVAASFSADLPGRKGAVLMAAPLPQPRYSFWGEAFGGTGNTDADGNAASQSRRTGGALLGADLMLYEAPGSSLKLGVAGGYSQSRFDLDARRSSGKLESGHAALYAGARFGNLRLDAGVAYSWSESDIRRQVAIRGFGDSLRLQRPGSVAQGFAELGYAFAFTGFALEPFAQLALIRVSTEAGTERGGVAALRVLSSEQTLGFTTLGLRAEAQIGAMPLFARGLIGWRHGFGELTPVAKTAFVAGITPSRAFAAPIDREALVAEAGLDWRISSSTALGLTYSAAIGERSRDHALKGRVEMRF